MGAGSGQDLLEGLGSIAPAVVGQDPLDRHAQLGEPGQGAATNPSGGQPVLAVTGLHIGQASAVIHRHMQIVRAQPMAAVTVGATLAPAQQPMPTPSGIRPRA
jgi:hypothetical protein